MKYNRTKVLGIWLAKSNPVERMMIVGREMRTREKRVKWEEKKKAIDFEIKYFRICKNLKNKLFNLHEILIV